MNTREISKILNDTDFTRTGGTAEELKAAEYLEGWAKKYGAKTCIEEFEVQMAGIKKGVLTVDGAEIPCKAYMNCGSGTVEKELVYLPNNDRASLLSAKDKIVLIDTGITYWVYKDLTEAGVAGIITYDGNVNFRDTDIDQKELRGFVADVGSGENREACL